MSETNSNVLPENPYTSGEELYFNLCEVVRSEPSSSGGESRPPAVNLGKPLYSFPTPTESVTVRQAKSFTEKENKSSGAMTVQFKKYDKPVEISFPVWLIEDEEPSGNAKAQYNFKIFTALEKYQQLNEEFKKRDEYGRPILYAPSYPLVPPEVTMCFIAAFDIQDQGGTDALKAVITLKQWHYMPPKTRGRSRTAAEEAAVAEGITGYPDWDTDLIGIQQEIFNQVDQFETTASYFETLGRW